MDQSIYDGHRKCSNAITSNLALGVCLWHSRWQGIAAEDMLSYQNPNLVHVMALWIVYARSFRILEMNILLL